MKKRCAAMALCLLLVLSALYASADTLTMTPTFYNPANDIADWHLDRRDISDELIQELRGGSFWGSLLPIRDDLMLWYGRFEYHNLIKEESFWLSYDVEMPRSDAYAVATDGEGKRLWSLRLSDPQAENHFTGAWLLDDGRIMLKFNDQVGEFGSQYYIVSQQGEVQEMLPAYRAKEYGVYEMLIPMHGGYFGGGMAMENDAMTTMYGQANFTFFDDAMTMQWHNDSEDFANCSLSAHEVSDGILLGGTINLNYIPDQPFLHQAPQMAPIALKLDLQGNVLWTYQGHELSVASADNIYETEDGGAIFLTHSDPTVPTAYGAPALATLVRLDAKGELLWVRQIEDVPLYIVGGLTPYGEGYLMQGYRLTDEDTEEISVMYVSGEGALIGTAVLDIGESDAANYHAYTSLVAAPDGGVYLAGVTVASEGMMAGMDNPQTYSPFYVDMGDVFPVRED